MAAMNYKGAFDILGVSGRLTQVSRSDFEAWFVKSASVKASSKTLGRASIFL